MGLGSLQPGQSLSLVDGLPRIDPSQPGQTRIPTHNDLWLNTFHSPSKFLVYQLNYPGGLLDPNSSVCGVRINVQLQPGSVNFMKDKQVTFDMGAWLQTPIVTSMLPYTMQTFPVVLIALEPDRWLLQVQPDGYIRFDHRVEEIMGTHLLSDEQTPDLTRSRHPHQGHKSIQRGFQQVFCGSGRHGDEHVRQGTAAHLGGGALPASKVPSDLQTSPDAFGFLTLGRPPRDI